MKNQSFAPVCILAYLKYLSELQGMSLRQKHVATVYLKELLSKGQYYEFMQSFGQVIVEALVLEDQLFIEYHGAYDSEVILHYMIDKGDGGELKYTACRIYPMCSGIYSKTFTMFEGEKILYFITEKKSDGSEYSTPAMTKEKESCILDSGTRYGRINTMRQYRKKQMQEKLAMEARQFHYLETAAEGLFILE